MSNKNPEEQEPKICIKCPPLKKVLDAKWIGKTVADVRKEFGEELEIPEGAPVVVSHDCGKTFQNATEDYVLEAFDVIEWGRTSAVKGF